MVKCALDSDFKVGDRVEYIGPPNNVLDLRAGNTGTLVEVAKPEDFFPDEWHKYKGLVTVAWHRWTITGPIAVPAKLLRKIEHF